MTPICSPQWQQAQQTLPGGKLRSEIYSSRSQDLLRFAALAELLPSEPPNLAIAIKACRVLLMWFSQREKVLATLQLQRWLERCAKLVGANP
jgi:hypothetical protein